MRHEGPEMLSDDPLKQWNAYGRSFKACGRAICPVRLPSSIGVDESEMGGLAIQKLVVLRKGNLSIPEKQACVKLAACHSN
jgi:hypothetical protein